MEKEVIERTDTPMTATSLNRDLAELGVREGACLLVHCALSALGWVVGGAPAVIAALGRSVGAEGTLVMPTHTSNLVDPSTWGNPPVPEHWWPDIRAEMPPFDPLVTPTQHMGALAECFRSWPGTLRSDHPTMSFAALGPHAATVIDGHSLADGMGEDSPLGALYQLDASVLLLGVGHDSNSSLHLAEHRAGYPGKTTVRQSSPVLRDGRPTWVDYPQLNYDADVFPALGKEFGETGLPGVGKVGMASATLMRQRELVDFAVTWLGTHRRA